jgi:hypothetical protein
VKKSWYWDALSARVGKKAATQMIRTRQLAQVLAAILATSASALGAPPSAKAQGAPKTQKKKTVAPPAPPVAEEAVAPPPSPPAVVEAAPVVQAPAQDATMTNAKDGAKDDYDSSDVSEDPSKRYVFLGARYRGTIFPSFLLAPFVREVRGFYFNTVGIEADIRKDGFSIIPALSYSEFGSGDILFADKTRDLKFAGNWGMVNSSLKGIYATVDFLWSVPIHKNLAFEYGLGAGVGFMFGDLVVNWVRDDPNGALTSSDGRRFSQCNTATEGPGCAVKDHENATTARVGRYSESSWFSGGAKPSILPHFSIPQIGVRFKPIKQLEARFGLGFSLTGFWFGLSANYGLEQPRSKTEPVVSSPKE